MSERLPTSGGEAAYDVLISRSSKEPGRAVYSIDDDLEVASVEGRHVRLYDGDGIAEEFDCASPLVAQREALRYALLLQRPPGPEGAP